MASVECTTICLSLSGCCCFGGGDDCLRVFVACHGPEAFPAKPPVLRPFRAPDAAPPRQSATATSIGCWADHEYEYETEPQTEDAARHSEEPIQKVETRQQPRPRMPETTEKPEKPRRCRGTLQLAHCLQHLDNFPEDRVVRLSRMLQFGDRGDEHVIKYLMQFGQVTTLERLMILEPRGERQKPSSVAYVVMDSAEEASRILARSEHEVLPGCWMPVRRFERRSRSPRC